MDIRFFKESLGIPKYIMPQIPNDKIEDFLNSLPCDTYDSDIELYFIRPTQSTYLEEKVADKHKYFKTSNDGESYGIKTLILSEDFYLLNGHHSYLGLVRTDYTATVNVTIVNMKMVELLLHACLYEHSYTQSYKELSGTII